jgi:hypothetical protein
MATENRFHFYIERRPEGDWTVRRGNSEWASAIAPTQEEAIARARQLDPDAAIELNASVTRKAVGALSKAAGVLSGESLEFSGERTTAKTTE